MDSSGSERITTNEEGYQDFLVVFFLSAIIQNLMMCGFKVLFHPQELPILSSLSTEMILKLTQEEKAKSLVSTWVGGGRVAMMAAL